MSIEQHQDVPTRPRTGTVVWGVILTLTGLAVLAIGLGVGVDLQVTLIVLLTVAGLGLLLKALTRPGRSSGQVDADAEGGRAGEG